MIINDQKIYDGSFIHKRFAYKYFRDRTLPIGNIVSFVSPVEVTLNLIDLEDSLEKDYIYSDSMVNFCWEIPNLDPFGAVCFQRLFNTTIANTLHKIINKPIEMKGDDVMVHAEHNQGGIVQQKGKASVSITYSKENVAIFNVRKHASEMKLITVTDKKRPKHETYSAYSVDSDLFSYRTL